MSFYFNHMQIVHRLWEIWWLKGCKQWLNHDFKTQFLEWWTTSISLQVRLFQPQSALSECQQMFMSMIGCINNIYSLECHWLMPDAPIIICSTAVCFSYTITPLLPLRFVSIDHGSTRPTALPLDNCVPLHCVTQGTLLTICLWHQ